LIAAKHLLKVRCCHRDVGEAFDIHSGCFIPTVDVTLFLVELEKVEEDAGSGESDTTALLLSTDVSDIIVPKNLTLSVMTPKSSTLSSSYNLGRKASVGESMFC
jgi:hypothetical protein